MTKNVNEEPTVPWADMTVTELEGALARVRDVQGRIHAEMVRRARLA